VQERLDAWTDKSGDCWLWMGSARKKGYGQIRIGNRSESVHRVAWVLKHGPIPDGLFVLHHCDTPACVRVEHLFLGSAHDNTQDMMAKGRDKHGVHQGIRHPKARLREEDILVIRQMHRDGVRLTDIAVRFGVTPQNISQIVSRKGWSHI
jgi:hypothetical protein